MRQTIILVLIYFGYQLAASVLMAAWNLIFPTDIMMQMAWSLILSGIALVFHLIHFKHIDLGQALRHIPWKPLLYSIGCVIGTMLCSNALSELANLPDWLKTQFTGMSQQLPGIISIAIMAPLVEELLFRGAILNHLRQQGFSPYKSILISAVIFGLIHLNPAQMLFAFLMGIAFGWITWRTGSLIPAIIGHTVNNSLGVAEMIWAENDTLMVQETTPTSVLWSTVAFGIIIALLMAKLLDKDLRQEENKTVN